MSESNEEYFLKTVEDTEKLLNTSAKGLTNEEAQKRIEEYGYNKLEEKKKKGIIAKFIDQFKNLMIIVLLVAAGISVITDPEEGLVDACIILFVVVINAILGVVQENKAENIATNKVEKTLFNIFIIK